MNVDGVHGDLTFLTGGGETGVSVRAYNWASTPLGPPRSWPRSLQTLVGVLLSAEQPMFIAWGPERTLLFNDGYAPILGPRAAGAMGRPFFDVWPEVRPQLTPLFGRVFDGEPIHMDDIALRLDRPGRPDEAHFAFSYTPVRDESGTVVGLFCPCTETTDQVLAQRRQAFRLGLETRLRDLVDPQDIMAAAVQALGAHLRVNRVGYGQVQPDDRTIVLSTNYVDGVEPLTGSFLLSSFGADNIARQRRGETVVHADISGDPASDPATWQAIHTRAFVSVPLVRDGRFVAGLYVNSREPRAWTADEVALVEEVASRTWDALERARAEADLREFAATLERQVAERTAQHDRVWRNSRDLLVVVGADGVFLAVNPAWSIILGHRPEDVVGRSFLDFIWPDDATLTQQGLDSASSADDLTDFENRYTHKDGTPRWISWHTSVQGELVYGYGRDVTAAKEQAEALRQTEAALRQSQKMEAVGQLTGGLAHDFNNLLTGIGGSLELMQSRVAQGRVNDLDRYLTAAMGAAKRAAALTHRLLAFSRRQTLAPKPTDANRLIAGMEELIRRTIGPAIDLEAVGTGGLWATLVDPNQLENALLNLCINARDAMPDGGRLTVETGNRWLDDRMAPQRELSPGQYVSICVSDTGTGMTAEVASRAFDPFFTTKPIGLGTGLGLSMTHGFVRQSGGQVRIYSEVGKGTMVCLYFPRHVAEGDAEDEAIDRAEAPRAQRGETVLVIDDEPTVRMLVTEVLGELGYEAIEAADGTEGLKVLRSSARIDLLVTDVGLPGGLNGRQVADAARVLRPGLKVLFITGFAENAVLNHGHLAAGMHVMTKPFEMTALASRVRELIAG